MIYGCVFNHVGCSLMLRPLPLILFQCIDVALALDDVGPKACNAIGRELVGNPNHVFCSLGWVDRSVEAEACIFIGREGSQEAQTCSFANRRANQEAPNNDIL